jgi:hypothetical protein
MKRRRSDLWQWVAVILAVVLLALGAVIQRPSNQFDAPTAHFEDATPTGSKGLALVLQQLGYTTRVQRVPLQTMPSDARVWFIFDPSTSFSDKEAKLLLAWVKSGKTLVFCSTSEYSYSLANSYETNSGIRALRQALGIQYTSSNAQSTKRTEVFPDFAPLRFDPAVPEREGVSKASAVPGQVETSQSPLALSGAGGTGKMTGPPLYRYDLDRGRVYVLPDAWIFTNHGLAKPDNAVLATNLVRLHAPRGAIVWDERQHSDNLRPPEPDSILARVRKPPFSYAIWQLFFAGLLLWAFTSRRLGMAVPLPERGPVTRASQFAMAMGGLFQKIGRPNAASQIIGDSFRRRLASRLGLSPADPDQVLARRAHEMSGVPYEVFDRLLLQTRTPARSDAQALRDAQEMETVLRQLEER